MRKILPIVLLLAACATRQAPAIRPDVRIAQISNVPLAARFMTGGMSVRYRVVVQNRGKEPITLQRVGVESMGIIGAYTVNHSAVFDLAIPPSGVREVAFWAATQTSDNAVGANGPVTLRVVASFQSPKGRFEDVTVQNVSGMGVTR